MKRWLAALGTLFLLTACTDPLTSGTIVDKRYEPDRRWTSFMPVRVGKITILVPMVHYDDEDYIVVISGTTKEGEVKTQELYLTKDRWEHANMGELFTLSEPELKTALSDPNERTRNRG